MKQKKHLTTKFLLLLFLLTSFLLSGYQFAAYPSDWQESPTGSAKYLDGSTVLVSLFIEDSSSNWTDDKKSLVMSKMDLATDFLVSEGTSYGKDVNLIYNIYDHPDLDYTLSYSGTIDDSEDCSYDLLDFVTDYIDTHIPTQKILSSYRVDSIAYMCFLDKDGVSYTFPYYEGDSDLYYYETCYMFLKCDGDYEPPAVYAHEILHLFGGRDLYSTNEIDGITKDFVQYIETYYPNEIMLTTYDENWNNVQSYVSNDLTDITAYFIGWLDTIPETANYPSIIPSYPASFAQQSDSIGDYSDYTAGDSDICRDDECYEWNTEGDRTGRWGSQTCDDINVCDSNGSHWGSDSDNAFCSDYSCYDDEYYDDEYFDDEYCDDDGDDLGLWDLIWIILWYLFQ